MGPQPSTETLDLLDTTIRWSAATRGRRLAVVWFCLALVAISVGIYYVALGLPFGGPGSAQRWTGIVLELTGASLFGVGAVLALVTWSGGRRGISRLALSDEGVTVYQANLRTRREFSWSSHYSWVGLRGAISISDYTRTGRAALASIPCKLHIGDANRHQDGGIDLASAASLVERARRLRMQVSQSTSNGVAITKISRPRREN